MTPKDITRLQTFARLGVLSVVVLMECAHRWLFPDAFDGTFGFITYIGLWIAVIILASNQVFRVLRRSQATLARQNREMFALHQSSLRIESRMELSAVLEDIVSEARQLVGAKYGGLSYVQPDGQLGGFVSQGFTCPPGRPAPLHHGVIGAVTEQRQAVRVDHVLQHPASVGFPENHPEMHPLLAVPILAREGVHGNLYVADDAGKTFDAESQQTLERFAALCSVAIENARLAEQAQVNAVNDERARIGREMHDSLAQVLGYVNTKAQATSLLIERGNPEKAQANLEQLAAAAREAYADVRESILSLRTTLGEGRSFVSALQQYLTMWQDHTGIRVELEMDEGIEGLITGIAEVHLLRIVQEALANVRKHAHATDVRVVFRKVDSAVELRIDDNGQGFPATGRGRVGVARFGLTTMRERAESLGGTVDVTSQTGAGTTVVVRVPDQTS